MSARGSIAVLASGLLALAGCSLVKLSADIVQGQCQEDSDCEELNDEGDPDFDPCQRWQCNTKQKLCEYGALDRDGDGQTPGTVMHGGEEVTCERDEAEQDCADDDADVAAGKPELCDDKDNDCDGRADEGALVPDSKRVVVFDGDDGASQLVAARDPMSGAVALGYGLLETVDARPGVSLLDPALSDGMSATPLTVEGVPMSKAQQVAVAPLDGGRFAYALRSDTGSKRIIAGVWRSSSSQLRVEEDIAQLGVPCLPGESCADAMMPALAAQEREVLLAYLRFGEDPEGVGCGELRDTGPAARIIANVLVRPSAEDVLRSQGEALEIGASSDLSPPALLGLPAIGAAEPSYLIAYADERGNIAVDRLLTAGGQLTVEQPGLIRLDDGSAPTSSVRLALGPVLSGEDGGQVVGIVHQRGCGSAARIVAGLHVLSSDDDGRLQVHALAGGIAIGNAPNESMPALAYSAERDAWLVVYRDLSGLHAVVLGADGTVYGGQPYQLVARVKPEDGDEVDLLPLSPAVFDLDGGFATLAHVLREAEDSPRAFEAIHLGCPEE